MPFSCSCSRRGIPALAGMTIGNGRARNGACSTDNRRGSSFFFLPCLLPSTSFRKPEQLLKEEEEAGRTDKDAAAKGRFRLPATQHSLLSPHSRFHNSSFIIPTSFPVCYPCYRLVGPHDAVSLNFAGDADNPFGGCGQVFADGRGGKGRVGLQHLRRDRRDNRGGK